MTREAIHDTLRAQPFKPFSLPFSLRLTDASLVHVPHPDIVVVSQGGGTAVINTTGEGFKIIDLRRVTAIEFGPASYAA